eukprot:1147004-Pelagomonas_calceolata.AAC.4
MPPATVPSTSLHDGLPITKPSYLLKPHLTFFKQAATRKPASQEQQALFLRPHCLAAGTCKPEHLGHGHIGSQRNCFATRTCGASTTVCLQAHMGSAQGLQPTQAESLLTGDASCKIARAGEQLISKHTKHVLCTRDTQSQQQS